MGFLFFFLLLTKLFFFLSFLSCKHPFSAFLSNLFNEMQGAVSETLPRGKAFQHFFSSLGWGRRPCDRSVLPRSRLPQITLRNARLRPARMDAFCPVHVSSLCSLSAIYSFFLVLDVMHVRYTPAIFLCFCFPEFW